MLRQDTLVDGRRRAFVRPIYPRAAFAPDFEPDLEREPDLEPPFPRRSSEPLERPKEEGDAIETSEVPSSEPTW